MAYLLRGPSWTTRTRRLRAIFSGTGGGGRRPPAARSRPDISAALPSGRAPRTAPATRPCRYQPTTSVSRSVSRHPLEQPGRARLGDRDRLARLPARTWRTASGAGGSRARRAPARCPGSRGTRLRRIPWGQAVHARCAPSRGGLRGMMLDRPLRQRGRKQVSRGSRLAGRCCRREPGRRPPMSTAGQTKVSGVPIRLAVVPVVVVLAPDFQRDPRR